MSIEIKDVRLILPALVSFEQNGEKLSTFVYIDQTKKDVIIPETSEIVDIDEFKKAFAQYYNSKNPVPKTPTLPSNEIFKKIDPNIFKGDLP
jgi:hypothetical protein